MDAYYGKKIKYVNNSGYFGLDSTEFIKQNTFFRFRFRTVEPHELTLMELSEDTNDYYIKVSVRPDGMISIYSNGVEYHSRDRILFEDNITDLIVRYYKDTTLTSLPIFEMFIKTGLGYKLVSAFTRVVDPITVSSTYLHVYKNCTIDTDLFQIYYETNYGNFT